MPTIALVQITTARNAGCPQIIWRFMIQAQKLIALSWKEGNNGQTTNCDFSDFPAHFNALCALIIRPDQITVDHGTVKELLKLIYSYPLWPSQIFQMQGCACTESCAVPIHYSNAIITTVGELVGLVNSAYLDGDTILTTITEDIEIKYHCSDPDAIEILKAGSGYIMSPIPSAIS